MALILAVSREVERRSSIDGGRLLWTSGDHIENVVFCSTAAGETILYLSTNNKLWLAGGKASV